MRTSRGEKEKLKEKILTDVLPFLKTSGRGAAPVDMLMKKAGLTSGALYSHFKSKDDFFVQVILRELDRLNEEYGQEVQAHGEKAFPRIIENYLSEEHVKNIEYGCVFSALGADMQRTKPAMKSLYEEKLAAIFATLSESIKHGSKEQRLAKTQFVFSSMVGSMIFARSMKSSKSAHEIIEASRNQLLTLLKKN